MDNKDRKLLDEVIEKVAEAVANFEFIQKPMYDEFRKRMEAHLDLTYPDHNYEIQDIDYDPETNKVTGKVVMIAKYIDIELKVGEPEESIDGNKSEEIG